MNGSIILTKDNIHCLPKVGETIKSEFIKMMFGPDMKVRVSEVIIPTKWMLFKYILGFKVIVAHLEMYTDY